MRIVGVPTDILANWVAAQIPGSGGFGECAGLGVEHDGELVAGVIYNNWNPEGGVIEMSAAATNRRWLTRPVLMRIFGYPFDDLGCEVVVSRTDPKNAHLRRMWKALGAVEHEIPDLRGLGKSEIVKVLTRPAWRANKFNKR